MISIIPSRQIIISVINLIWAPNTLKISHFWTFILLINRGRFRSVSTAPCFSFCLKLKLFGISILYPLFVDSGFKELVFIWSVFVFGQFEIFIIWFLNPLIKHIGRSLLKCNIHVFNSAVDWFEFSIEIKDLPDVQFC